MSITVTFDCYTDICELYAYGKHILELSDEVQENLNNYFDGADLGSNDSANPDNIWVNHIYILSHKEVIEDELGLDEEPSDFESLLYDLDGYLGKNAEDEYVFLK